MFDYQQKELNKYGFTFQKSSVHTKRTMMLKELEKLLDNIPPTAPQETYKKAIVEENILSKTSSANRNYTESYLTQLYAFNPEVPLFASLCYLWNRDEKSHPLLALLFVYVRDPLIRESWKYIKSLEVDEIPEKSKLEELLEEAYPNRFSMKVKQSIGRNILSTWTQSGHLTGRKNKKRSHPQIGVAAVTFALLLGYITGIRGQLLFTTIYTELLDCSYSQLLESAHEASKRGLLIMKHIEDIIEIEFPAAIFSLLEDYSHE